MPTTTVPLYSVAPSARALTARLGIQVYWHTSGDADDVRAKADRVLDYAASLGANSVGLTFPFFTDGTKPTHVYTTSETPDPQTLKIVIDEAQSRGLDVMLRPLLDEGNMQSVKNAWRGSIAPPSESAWMASYAQFLAPYLALAQSEHVGHFVIGTELVSLTDRANSLWDGVLKEAHAAYSGDLAYADNWDTWRAGTTHSPVPNSGLDAYPIIQLGDSASVAQLKNAWDAYLTHRSSSVLHQTVIQEIGIAAQSGSYKQPYMWGTSTDAPDIPIQQNWFAAACQSAKSLGMKGIYFWSLDSNADPTPSVAAKAPVGSFIGRGDVSIKACFASGWS